MDQSTLNAEDATETRHAAGTVHPADAALPAVAAFPSETARPECAENPEDVAYHHRVNVRDPEAAWLPAQHSCSRCQLLYWVGALVLLLGVVCVPIAFFTRIPTLPTFTTSPTPGTSEKTSNLTATPVPLNGYPQTTGQGSSVFANLQAKNEASLLRNRTLSWHSLEGAGNSKLYRGLRYDEEKDELVVDNAGLYYVILQLKLSPVSKNTDHTVWGQVSLVLQLNPQVENLDNLALTVDLFPCSMEANLVEGSWGHLIHLKAGHRLSVKLNAYMHGAQEAYNDWQLSQTTITSFVLFLVQPETSQELSSTG
ncbi:Tnfsf9 [Phodopus roborovskii]|uniref:Tnfsf9 protein n=2 Tax=Phodopus roborovskii TaxID=109678 RepID=A0AAU9YXX3_PHORO|nr:Tnfsf9 [Phodopus roborovskii]